jgi:predicted RNA polymerase sigma factor
VGPRPDRGGPDAGRHRTARRRTRALRVAAISAVHDDAASVETTDWPQIVALYDVLVSVAPSPLVALDPAPSLTAHPVPRYGAITADPLMLG